MHKERVRRWSTKSTKSKRDGRVCDHCGKKKRGHLGVAVEGRRVEVSTEFGSPVPWDVAPDSGESQIGVVAVTLRGPLRV